MHHLPCFQFLHLLIHVLLLLSVSVGSGGATAAAVFDHGEFIYNDFYDDNVTMDGQALIFSGILRLTIGDSDYNHNKGHAFYPYPIDF